MNWNASFVACSALSNHFVYCLLLNSRIIKCLVRQVLPPALLFIVNKFYCNFIVIFLLLYINSTNAAESSSQCLETPRFKIVSSAPSHSGTSLSKLWRKCDAPTHTHTQRHIYTESSPCAGHAQESSKFECYLELGLGLRNDAPGSPRPQDTLETPHIWTRARIQQRHLVHVASDGYDDVLRLQHNKEQTSVCDLSWTCIIFVT